MDIDKIVRDFENLTLKKIAEMNSKTVPITVDVSEFDILVLDTYANLVETDQRTMASVVFNLGIRTFAETLNEKKRRER